MKNTVTILSILATCLLAGGCGARNAEYYLNRGVRYAESHDYEKAIKEFNIALELNPDDVRALQCRGALYARLDQYERAIEDYRRVVELHPTSAVPYVEMSGIYEMRGRVEKAREYFEKEEKRKATP